MKSKSISVVLPILVPTPFLRAMTEFTIKTLRMHADHEFELVVVEAEHNYFEEYALKKQSVDCAGIGPGCFHPLRINNYLNFNPKIGGIKELNEGLAAASGEFILSTGNDVVVPPHWDTELLRCFEERKDCGAASLSAYEPGAIVGPTQAQDRIVEGMYSPFMMFRRGVQFSEDYRKIYQDSDFIMRLYEQGLRSYRSCRAHVHHLLRMTSDRVGTEQHARDLAHDERLFYQRWGKSPLMMFGLIRYGQWTYGRESDSLTNLINLHYDPREPGPSWVNPVVKTFASG